MAAVSALVDRPRIPRPFYVRTPTTENEIKMLMRRACARTHRTPSPRSFFAARTTHCAAFACSPHPARSADWPHGPCSMYPGD